MANQFHDPRVMVVIAALEVIRPGARIASHKKFSGDIRARRSRYRGFDAAARHFPLQRPENLLSAARAVFRNGEEGVRDVEDAHVDRARGGTGLQACDRESRRILVLAAEVSLTAGAEARFLFEFAAG